MLYRLGGNLVHAAWQHNDEEEEKDEFNCGDTANLSKQAELEEAEGRRGALKHLLTLY